MKILVTPTSMSEETKSPAMDTLRSFASELVFNETGRPLVQKELIPLLSGVDGVIAGLDYYDEKVIKSAPDSLRVISRYGAGYDRIDLAAAARRKIMVTNTPGANANAVADLTFGLMLCMARRIHTLDKGVREGKWIRSSGVELFGKTLGIIGLGSIGKGVAKRAQGFSMRILAYDPYADGRYMVENAIESSSLDTVLSQSDFISLHVPFNPKTKHMINASAINKMKPGAILINTSRGGLIDEQAIYEALSINRLGGLGLDVYETEPPEASKLLELDNVVVTPHTGAHTMESAESMARMSVEHLIDILSGKFCANIVNRFNDLDLGP